MGACFLYGNGGGSNNLVFRVYACTALPASAKENDVAIITSTPISTWEVYPWTPDLDSNEGHVYLTSTHPTNGNYPNVNIVNPSKTGGFIWVQLICCYQRESGKWVSKDAYQYRGGQWIQFSAVFAATINVAYPPGSTCTATCGSTTLTAPDTSGTWACVVPNAGTWTITATDGTNTKSEAISITTDGQSESITLSYRYYLYNYLDGQTAYDGITGGWNRYTTKDGCISLYNDANMDAPTRCKSKIDFRGYKTLCAEVICWNNTSGESGTSFAIGTQTDTSIHTWGAIRGSLCGKADTDWTVKTIDVSSITEPVYFSFRGYYSYSAIRAMWLE